MNMIKDDQAAPCAKIQRTVHLKREISAAHIRKSLKLQRQFIPVDSFSNADIWMRDLVIRELSDYLLEGKYQVIAGNCRWNKYGDNGYWYGVEVICENENDAVMLKLMLQ